MSIPSGIKPSDQSKWRETYMNSLRLDAANQQKSLDAQRLLEETGEVVRSRDDPRTLTEKLQDVERIKVQVLSDLKQITSGDEAIKIVSSLDNSELLFLYNAMQLIVADIKPKFRVGVPSAIFIPYLKKMMQTAERSQGVSYGLQTGSAKNAKLTDKNIVGTLVSEEKLNDLEKVVKEQSVAEKDQALALIRQMKNHIPDKDELLSIRQLGKKGEVQSLLTDMLENVPTEKRVDDMLQKIIASQLRKDSSDMSGLLRQLISMLDLPQSDIIQRKVLEELVMEQVSDKQSPVEAEAEMGGTLMKVSIFKDLTAGAMRSILQDLKDRGEIMISKTKVRTANKAELTEVYRKWYNEQPTAVIEATGESALPSSAPPRVEGVKAPISGSGVGKCVVPNKHPTIRKHYKKLGTKCINERKLNDNILSLIYSNGIPIPSLKATKVSPKFSNIIRTMIGGGLPKHEDLNNLDTDEQRLLLRTAKHAKIDHTISLPTPDKDAEEKEEHRFMVLKGQILAGNDSVPLVKEFKKMLMKLMKERRIQRREALDILEILVSMGY